jgi:hypothetical protein
MLSPVRIDLSAPLFAILRGDRGELSERESLEQGVCTFFCKALLAKSPNFPVRRAFTK